MGPSVPSGNDSRKYLTEDPYAIVQPKLTEQVIACTEDHLRAAWRIIFGIGERFGHCACRSMY